MRVERLDFAKYGKAIRLDNGFLRLPITATRTGIFVYKGPDGKEWRELRPAEEVFHADSMNSLKGIPFTNDHPKEMVNRKNAKQHMVGYTSDDVRQDSQFLKTFVTVTEDATIEMIEKRDKREVSCGYHSDLDFTPGVFNGQRYDAVQRNIRYNHVALVKRGRAGAEVKVHLDSSETESVLRFDSYIELPEENQPREDNNEGAVSMKTVLINGVEVKVEDSGYEVLVAKIKKDSDDLAAATAKITELSTEKTQVQAKFDSANEELTAVKQRLDDKKAFNAAVAKRIKLEKFATGKLDGDLTSMSDEDIIVKLIQKNNKDFKLDGIEEANRSVYLQSRLDSMLENFVEKGGAISQLESSLKSRTKNDSAEQKTSEQIRKERMDKDRNAWKEPIGFSLKK